MASYKASFRSELIRTMDDMLANLKSKKELVRWKVFLTRLLSFQIHIHHTYTYNLVLCSQVVDGRSAGRFNGTDPEPNPSESIVFVRISNNRLMHMYSPLAHTHTKHSLLVSTHSCLAFTPGQHTLLLNIHMLVSTHSCLAVTPSQYTLILSIRS